MHAAALRVEVRIPGVASLKGKRRVLRGLRAALETAFPVGIAEVGRQDAWQFATMGVALVSGEHGQLESMISAIQRTILEYPEVELVEIGVAYLEEE
ncbi:MAG TPA: DUF503 domain-containing protein [Acidimicrobiia bacterium]|nr:DUF503 domain-containing protein [Acidimicrobiia bacterium]